MHVSAIRFSGTQTQEKVLGLRDWLQAHTPLDSSAAHSKTMWFLNAQPILPSIAPEGRGALNVLNLLTRAGSKQKQHPLLSIAALVSVQPRASRSGNSLSKLSLPGWCNVQGRSLPMFYITGFYDPQGNLRETGIINLRGSRRRVSVLDKCRVPEKYTRHLPALVSLAHKAFCSG